MVVRRFPHVNEQYDGPERPGPYLAPRGFGSPAVPSPPPFARPRQVVVSAVIAFGLAALSGLVAVVVLLTPQGAELSQTLTERDDAQGLVGFAALVSVALYVVPAVFVLQRRPWARILMIAIAGLGIAGGVVSLPGGVLGLGLHAVILAAMLQPSTRAWFGVRH